MRTRFPCGVAVALAAAASGAVAQPAGKSASPSDYPSRSIRFVVPFTPGGTVDILARVISPRLSEALGQQVVVDNRGGSAGVIGTEIAARSPPDGYTLMLGNTASIAINPGLYSKLPYDPVRDFAPVTLVALAPYVLVVPPSLPARSVKEMLALARARPGQLAYASTGNGSVGHLSGELLAFMAGVKLQHVPYKNIGQMMTELMSGQVQLLFLGVVSAGPYVRTGKLRALAMSGSKRSSMLPETPTVAESGVRDFEVTGWYGVFVPAGTPPQIVMRLNAEIVRIINGPEVRERLSSEGADLVGNTPGQFAAYVKSEVAKWAKVVKLSGARVD